MYSGFAQYLDSVKIGKQKDDRKLIINNQCKVLNLRTLSEFSKRYIPF